MTYFYHIFKTGKLRIGIWASFNLCMTKMQHWLQSLTLIKKKSVCYAAVAVDYKPNPYPMNSGFDWSKGSGSNATVPGEDDRRIRVRTFQIGSHGTCKNIVILDPHREWSLHANKVEIKEDAISHNHNAERKIPAYTVPAF